MAAFRSRAAGSLGAIPDSSDFRHRGPSGRALLTLTVFPYGTLVLGERRSGHIIMLLIGLFAAAMPVIHMRGAHYGEIAKSPGGFFFVWTLWALGGLGGCTLILAARGLWSLPWRRPR